MPGLIPGTSAMLDTAAPARELPAAAPFMGAPPTLPPVKSGRGGRPNGKGYAAKGGRGGKAAAPGETTSNVTPSKEAAPAGAQNLIISILQCISNAHFWDMYQAKRCPGRVRSHEVLQGCCAWRDHQQCDSQQGSCTCRSCLASSDSACSFPATCVEKGQFQGFKAMMDCLYDMSSRDHLWQRIFTRLLSIADFSWVISHDMHCALEPAWEGCYQLMRISNCQPGVLLRSDIWRHYV